MTAVLVLVGALAVVSLLLAGLLIRQLIRSRQQRQAVRLQTLSTQLADIRRFAVLLAAMATGRQGGMVKIPKALVDELESWSFLPVTTPAGGINVTVSRAGEAKLAARTPKRHSKPAGKKTAHA